MPWHDLTSFDPTGASPFSLSEEELPGLMQPEQICLVHLFILNRREGVGAGRLVGTQEGPLGKQSPNSSPGR